MRFSASLSLLLFSTLVATAPGFPPGGASAQLVDKGTFYLTVNGEALGTEEFEIRRSGAGNAQTILAQGTVTYRAGGTVQTILKTTGPSMMVIHYRVKTGGGAQGSTDGAKEVIVVRLGNRFEARTKAEWGEELREYRARTETALLEEEVAHHHFLLAPLIQTGATSVHMLSPLSETETELVGVSQSDESITIGVENIATTKLRIGAGAGLRELWFDSSGRVMRVSIPARNFLAERVPGN